MLRVMPSAAEAEMDENGDDADEPETDVEPERARVSG
jgi:hypothetical protein